MKLPYTVMLRRDEEGDFIARIKELEGCVADGQDEIEALGNIEKVKELWIETALKANQAIPQPEEDEELPSGKFLTRVPRSLHKSLIDIAQRENVSLNQFVTVALAEATGRKSAVPTKIEVHAAAHGQSTTGEYGSASGTPRLRLVSFKRESTPSNSQILTESILTDVLSVQSVSHHSKRKEA